VIVEGVHFLDSRLLAEKEMGMRHPLAGASKRGSLLKTKELTSTSHYEGGSKRSKDNASQ